MNEVITLLLIVAAGAYAGTVLANATVDAWHHHRRVLDAARRRKHE